MTQQNIMEQASQGNPQAIKALLNQSLQPKGITVKVRLKNNCLMVIAESSEPPEKSFMVNFIREKMEDLRPQSVSRVVVQGRATGNTSTVWRVGFNLNSDSSATAERNVEVSPDNPFGPVESDPLSPATTESTAGPNTESRPLHPILAFLKLNLPILTGLYAISLVSLVALAVSIKWVASELAETYLYSIQVLGDLFRALQIVEVLNIIVFAIFGMGVGAATALLPQFRARYISAIFLIITVPIIANVSHIYSYYIWLEEVGNQEKISGEQAAQITDSFLMKRTGNKGFLGFYLHTADYPQLPTRSSQMESLANEKQEVVSRFASLGKLNPKRMGEIFAIAGWFIRGFYLLVAAVVTATHYREGLTEISRIIRQGNEN